MVRRDAGQDFRSVHFPAAGTSDGLAPALTMLRLLRGDRSIDQLFSNGPTYSIGQPNAISKRPLFTLNELFPSWYTPTL